MKKMILAVMAGLMMGLVPLIAPTPSYAVVPQILPYQGQLKDAAGTPVNGVVNITFNLYDAASGGLLLWSETHTGVNITKGLFKVDLGADPANLFTPGPGGTFDTPVWLGVTIGTDPEMFPRTALDSTPYALHADDADTVGGFSSSQLDQSVHVADTTTNPHNVTAAQTGAEVAGAAAGVQTNLDTHVANASAHHAKTTSFVDLTDTAADAQIPPLIARDTEVTLAVSAHAGLPSVHHTRYADSEATAAVGANWSALVNPAGTGSPNVAYGAGALLSNTTGYQNTASGDGALMLNTTGFKNTASGISALKFNTAGNKNTASGAFVLFKNTTGFSNTASGTLALSKNTTGNSNTASGDSALLSNTTGNQNTALGRSAGNINSTGSGNVFLGYNAGWGESGSNKLYIANSATNPPLIYGNFALGRVGIGTMAPGTKLHIKGSGWPSSFLSLDTNSTAQDAGIRFDEAGIVKWHLYNQGNAADKLNIRDGNSVPVMTFNQGGNVDVSGNMNVGGKLVGGARGIRVNGGISVCGSNGSITLQTTCTTNVCAPVVPPLFWACNHTCGLLSPSTCILPILGYLVAP